MSADAEGRSFIMEVTVMTIVWASAFVAAIFIEAETAEMVALWFMPGAIVSLILSLFNVDVWIQCVIFVATSTILLVLAKTVFKNKLKGKIGVEKTDTDLLIGKQAKVEEDIINCEEKGAVRINGQIWSARMADDRDSAVAGEFVTVERISGVKLICKK